MTKKTSKMRTKIEALLRKASDPAATEAEAETYAAAAHDLMLKYGVEASTLDDGEPDEISSRTVLVTTIYSSARMSLLHHVAQNMSCSTFYSKGKCDTLYVTVVGHTRDLESVLDLYALLDAQAVSEMKKFGRSDTVQAMPTGAPRFKAKRAFLFAFAARVGARLHDSRKQATRDDGSSLLPVLVSRAQKVADYVDDRYNLSKGSSRGLQGDAAGAVAGSAAGARANLGGSSVRGARGALGA